MTDELIARCELFVENRAVFDRVYRLKERFELSACALYMAAHGNRADEDRLRECRAVLNENTGLLSYMRETSYAAVTLMAVSNDPEAMLERICSAYSALRNRFHRSTSLCLAAMMLAVTSDGSDHAGMVSAAHEQYDCFKQKHRFRMSWHDSALSLLLAMRQVLPGQAADYAETCFRSLRRRPAFRCSWVFAQVLSAHPYNAEGRCDSARELRAALRKTFGRLSFEREIAALFLDIEGSLSVIEDAAAVYDWLRGDKRFSGWHISREERVMLSFLLASPQDAMLYVAASLCIRKHEEQHAAAAAA